MSAANDPGRRAADEREVAGRGRPQWGFKASACPLLLFD